MPTALTGSMGWTGLHPLQLGGPPLVSAWGRPLAQRALPLIAHVYESDGVTAKGTFPVLGRPSIKATTANGGYDQITLEVASQSTAAVWGQFTWGTTTWGGKVLQGNVIRLTEDGGPWPGYIYGGVVESLPDTRSATGTKHEIVVTPFGAELTRVGTQLVYSVGTDIAQVVRDAVALTQHCHCDHNADRGLGNGAYQLFLPVWLQKSFGKWTTYGGGGYWINHATDARNNWYFGWLLQRELSEHWTLGAEIFHRTEQFKGQGASTGFNVGGYYNFDEHNHLLFSAGRGLQNAAATNEFSSYVAYQLTY